MGCRAAACQGAQTKGVLLHACSTGSSMAGRLSSLRRSQLVSEGSTAMQAPRTKRREGMESLAVQAR